MKRFVVLALGLGMVSSTIAAVDARPAQYSFGGTNFEGYLARPHGATGKLPLVLIVHDWDGIGTYEQGRAKQVAELGYVAFCIDVYGRGVRPKDAKEAGAESGKYYSNANLFHERLQAGMSFALNQAGVDKTKVAAMGYCFGGSAVLEMARLNLPLKGVVSFHGGLTGPTTAKQMIKPKILVLTGDADPMVPSKAVASFRAEMNDAKATYRIESYKGAGHAFTVPGSEKMGIKGVGYQKAADVASWAEMKKFFKGLFGA
ncbi:MAG: dienelactone hydrolase family protein [Armatimonadetes bacterium]|nr:dienelactone hydrolase family protein [Armatimonadota bacterium]